MSGAAEPLPAPIVVVGGGSLGQVYAARLCQGGLPVTLVARRETAGRLLGRGHLRLTGDVELSVPVVSEEAGPAAAGPVVVADGYSGPAAGLVFATKIQDLAAAVRLLAGAKPSWVFGVQNGLVKDDVLAGVFGTSVVLGGASTIAAERCADMTVHVAAAGVTYLGPLHANAAGAAGLAAAALNEVGLSCELVHDPREVEWAKLMQAAPAFAVQMTVRHISAPLWGDPAQARAALKVLREIGRIAAQEGVSIRDYPTIPSHSDLTEDDNAVLARHAAGIAAWAGGSGFRSSLLQDLLAGRPTEAPELFADLVRRADHHGLAVPVLRFVADLADAL